jgi:hypothetical protein
MTPLEPQSLGYLINLFKPSNFNLWKVLTRLNEQDANFVQNQAIQNEILDSFEYSFQLPGVAMVGNDVYPVWKQVFFTLDGNNNSIGIGQRITRIDINAKTAPVGSSFIVDLLVSKDKGVTFNSIFPPTNAKKLVLPIGLHWIKYGGTFALAADTLQDGWWWRVDVLQADGSTAAVEIAVRGKLLLA